MYEVLKYIISEMSKRLQKFFFHICLIFEIFQNYPLKDHGFFSCKKALKTAISIAKSK